MDIRKMNKRNNGHKKARFCVGATHLSPLPPLDLQCMEGSDGRQSRINCFLAGSSTFFMISSIDFHKYNPSGKNGFCVSQPMVDGPHC